MQATTREPASPVSDVDEELIDTLIAISVFAKRLAQKLRNQNEIMKKEVNPSEQDENIGDDHG